MPETSPDPPLAYIVHQRTNKRVATVPQGADLGRTYAEYCVLHGDYSLDFYQLVWAENAPAQPPAVHLPFQVHMSGSGTDYIWYKRHYCERYILQVCATVEPLARATLAQAGFPMLEGL